MAILIPNMEMPDTCADCLLEYDSMRCRALSEDFFGKEHFDFTVERLPNCPLREIDVDAQTFLILVRLAKEYTYTETWEALQIAKQLSDASMTDQKAMEIVWSLMRNMVEVASGHELSHIALEETIGALARVLRLAMQNTAEKDGDGA